ncbi:MAG: hypothetical protein ACRDVM_05895 [Acidimicrobiia bacterium]
MDVGVLDPVTMLAASGKRAAKSEMNGIEHRPRGSRIEILAAALAARVLDACSIVVASMPIVVIAGRHPGDSVARLLHDTPPD